MIDIGYTFLLDVYNKALAYNGVFYSIVGLKMFAVSFLVITYYLRYIKSTGESISDAKKSNPITINDLYVGLAYVLAIIAFDYVLYFLDYIFGTLTDITLMKSSVLPPPADTVDVVGVGVVDQGSDSTLKAILDQILVLANPLTWITKSFNFISWIIDQFIFGFFLTQRFFIMGVLRIIGPIALLLAIFPQTKHYFIKWISTYISQYLLIIPFFAVTGFINILYKSLEPLTASMGPMIIGTISFFVIFLKISLFVTSKRIVKTIFS